MPASTAAQRSNLTRRYRNCPLDCPMYPGHIIETLSDFFAVFHSLLDPGQLFWFRGHSMKTFQLCPSALRHDTVEKRNRALGLVNEAQRFLDMKLARPPAPDDQLGWLQVAQHYGLETRLLDWTQNAAVALFFACCDHVDTDGLVAVLNPIELNQLAHPRQPRIFNVQRDAHLIGRYLSLNGVESRRGGMGTIAINPTWNTERIAMQQGVFTLHGSRRFSLDRSQASSLLYVPILKEHKPRLLSELERVGIGEMFIFPEPEHVCSHLRRWAKL
jgi:hypothetical protein